MSREFPTPTLRQSVKWGERYVSSALNKKFAGIIPAGIYHGFRLKPGGVMHVLVEHDPDYPSLSVAVVERNGFSLTVAMDDPGYVEIPTTGEWFIVLEAFYIETQTGYQRIVARQALEPHHVVLGKVSVPNGAEANLTITSDMLTEDCRTEGSDVTNAALDVISSIVEALRSPKETVWTLDEPVSSNGVLTLPKGIVYAPGQHLIDLSWDGLICHLGQQFQERMPADGALESNTLTLLFDAPKDSEFRILVRGYSLEESLPAKPASSIMQKVVNLENTLTQVITTDKDILVRSK